MQDTNFSKFVSQEEFELKVLTKIEGGLEDSHKYVEFFADDEVKIVFWRIDDNVYLNYYKKVNDEYVLKKQTFKNLTDSYGCFKVLPKGCRYEGAFNEYIKHICVGYDQLGAKIQKGLIRISVAEGNTGREFNSTTEIKPERVAKDFAECIRSHTDTFSVQLECAVKGIPFDHQEGVKQLRAI